MPASADPPPAIVNDVVATFSAGIYCPGEPVRRDDAPGTTSGSINIIEAPSEFIVETQTVPAVPGVGFGVLIALDLGEARDVTVFVTHPPFEGSGVTDEFWFTSFDEGTSLNGFTFEHAYELRPGTWTFSAEAAGEPIYSVVFEVVEPARAPELAGICSGAVLS